MNEITKVNKIKVNKTGNIGSIIGGYIDSYITTEEINQINNKIEKLNANLNDFDIFKYKIINRIKIRNLLVKVLSESSDEFVDIAVEILKLSEDNLENIIDGFMSLTKSDIDILYHNLWKKRGNEKYDVISLKKEIGSNFENVPDLIMSYAYRVNKEDFKKNSNSLLIGQFLTLMPEKDSSFLFNVFEKLSFNNFIKLAMYIPDKTKDSFNTYLCFNFTYLGIHLCKIMEKLENNIKERKNE